MAQVAPYGAWKSPISADLVAAGEIGLEQLQVDGNDVYWIERRPQEGGRKVIVRRSSDGFVADLTPASFNARTRVHEYGGGDYAVSDGTILFANFADQRLYIQRRGSEPKPLTPAAELRYADGQIDGRRQLFFCVREDHTTHSKPVNTIVGVGLDSGATEKIAASGNDFYSSPRLSPDGSRLAWLTWNHPNMPWDGTELWVGQLNKDGSVVEKTRVAGAANESVSQPQWAPDGALYFVSDRTGWWNIYRWQGGTAAALHRTEAEFGEPQWVFGNTLYGFTSEGRIICGYARNNRWLVAGLDPATGSLDAIALPYSAISQVRTTGAGAILIAASATEPATVISLDQKTHAVTILHRSRERTVDSGYISAPRAMEFPTEHGLTAHGNFYPAHNRDYAGPAHEKPPLLVISHGGPTSASSASLRYSIQYWTSRGIAVLDVNYAGSSGYGREYRERLKGRWGIADVDDCANGARYLVETGQVDGNRLAIRGGSAGGYTTLCALTFRNIFKAGASHYGISDLEALAKDTHKFESRYLDGLVGSYPERRDLYVERSPIHFTDRLACPMILFQGLEDRIVPPNQAEKMFEAVRAKKLPVAYLTFAGEQHGFRKAENIRRALEAELYFYSRVFGFTLADPVEPVPIENLPA
jgi:dipeptidyl aminopeptidase/acylaminoacyl peptidase